MCRVLNEWGAISVSVIWVWHWPIFLLTFQVVILFTSFVAFPASARPHNGKESKDLVEEILTDLDQVNQTTVTSRKDSFFENDLTDLTVSTRLRRSQSPCLDKVRRFNCFGTVFKEVICKSSTTTGCHDIRMKIGYGKCETVKTRVKGGGGKFCLINTSCECASWVEQLCPVLSVLLLFRAYSLDSSE